MQNCDKVLKVYVHAPNYVPVIKSLGIFPFDKSPSGNQELQ